MGPEKVSQSLHPSKPNSYSKYPNIWPTELSSSTFDSERFKKVLCDYFEQMESLAAMLMEIFALSLGLDKDYFYDKIDKRDISSMRLLYYPKVDALTDDFGAGEHSDWGTLSILYVMNNIQGLQVYHRECKQWRDVVIPECEEPLFIVNIGDMMSRWTNDKWVSTIHRVLPFRGDEKGNEFRLSIAFFHNPNSDTVIQSLFPNESSNYPPVTAGDYLRNKFESIST